MGIVGVAVGGYYLWEYWLANKVFILCNMIKYGPRFVRVVEGFLLEMGRHPVQIVNNEYQRVVWHFVKKAFVHMSRMPNERMGMRYAAMTAMFASSIGHHAVAATVYDHLEEAANDVWDWFEQDPLTKERESVQKAARAEQTTAEVVGANINLNSENAKLRQKNTVLTAKGANKDRTIAAQAQTIRAQQGSINALTGRVNFLTAQNGALTGQRDAAEDRVQQLEETNAGLEGSNQVLHATNIRFYDQHQTDIANAGAARVRMTNLERDLAGAGRNIENLRGKIRRLKNFITGLTAQRVDARPHARRRRGSSGNINVDEVRRTITRPAQPAAQRSEELFQTMPRREPRGAAPAQPRPIVFSHRTNALLASAGKRTNNLQDLQDLVGQFGAELQARQFPEQVNRILQKHGFAPNNGEDLRKFIVKQDGHIADQTITIQKLRRRASEAENAVTAEQKVTAGFRKAAASESAAKERANNLLTEERKKNSEKDKTIERLQTANNDMAEDLELRDRTIADLKEDIQRKDEENAFLQPFWKSLTDLLARWNVENVDELEAKLQAAVDFQRDIEALRAQMHTGEDAAEETLDEWLSRVEGLDGFDHYILEFAQKHGCADKYELVEKYERAMEFKADIEGFLEDDFIVDPPVEGEVREEVTLELSESISAAIPEGEVEFPSDVNDVLEKFGLEPNNPDDLQVAALKMADEIDFVDQSIIDAQTQTDTGQPDADAQLGYREPVRVWAAASEEAPDYPDEEVQTDAPILSVHHDEGASFPPQVQPVVPEQDPMVFRILQATQSHTLDEALEKFTEAKEVAASSVGLITEFGRNILVPGMLRIDRAERLAEPIRSYEKLDLPFSAIELTEQTGKLLVKALLKMGIKVDPDYIDAQYHFPISIDRGIIVAQKIREGIDFAKLHVKRIAQEPEPDPEPEAVE